MSVASISVSPIVLYGSVQNATTASKSNSSKQLLIKDHQNSILAAAECINKYEYNLSNEKHKYSKVTVIDDANKSHTVFVKVKSLKLTGESKKTSHSETELVDMMKQQGMDKYLRLTSMKVIVEVKKTKTHSQQQLNASQVLFLVKDIEMNKDEWIKEANEKNHWLKKTIEVPDKIQGTLKVTIEIFPKTRRKIDSLGQIDIKLRHIGSGGLKNVHESFNYQKSTLTAGLYTKMSDEADKQNQKEKVQTEINVQTTLLEAEPKDKKKFMLSKAIDIREDSSSGKTRTKVKFTQRLLKESSLFDVMTSGRLPDGTPLDAKTSKIFTQDILHSLEYFEKMGIVHRDLKTENIQIVYSKKEKRFVAKLADFDLALDNKKNLKVVGTPHYIAPEVLMGEGADHRSDFYGLGKSLSPQYDPWWRKGQLVEGLLHKYMEDKETYFEEPRDKNSYAWFNWKMTHPDKMQRFQSAAEARKFLESLPPPTEPSLSLEMQMHVRVDDDDGPMFKALRPKIPRF
ncbi:MAG: protein kinase [Parachlamydiales bacterium]|jgi:serine/threonine protein kinase